MEVYFLSTLIIIVFVLLIYSSIKTKKIYSEDIEYEPKHEETIKKIEKKLAQKGYKFQKISKFECYYYVDKQKERILLPRIRIYRKKFRNFGLLINSQGGSIKDNPSLKKEILELLMSKKIYSIIVFNEKNGSFEFVKEKNHWIVLNIILIILILTLYFVIKY